MKYKPEAIWIGLETPNDDLFENLIKSPTKNFANLDTPHIAPSGEGLPISENEMEILNVNLKLYNRNRVILNKKINLKLLHIVDFDPGDNQLPDLTLNIYSIELPPEYRLESERLTIEILSEEFFVIGSHKRKVIKPCILDVSYIINWGEMARNEIGLESESDSGYAESLSTWYKFISTMGDGYNRKQQKFIKVGDSRLAYISVKINQ